MGVGAGQMSRVDSVRLRSRNRAHPQRVRLSGPMHFSRSATVLMRQQKRGLPRLFSQVARSAITRLSSRG